MSEKELFKYTTAEEFFRHNRELTEARVQAAKKRYEQGTLIVKEEGQWTIKLGLEKSYDDWPENLQIELG